MAQLASAEASDAVISLSKLISLTISLHRKQTRERAKTFRARRQGLAVAIIAILSVSSGRL